MSCLLDRACEYFCGDCVPVSDSLNVGVLRSTAELSGSLISNDVLHHMEQIDSLSNLLALGRTLPRRKVLSYTTGKKKFIPHMKSTSVSPLLDEEGFLSYVKYRAATAKAEESAHVNRYLAFVDKHPGFPKVFCHVVVCIIFYLMTTNISLFGYMVLFIMFYYLLFYLESNNFISTHKITDSLMGVKASTIPTKLDSIRSAIDTTIIVNNFIKEWSTVLLDPDSSDVNPDNKLLLLELKFVVHALYHICNGNYANALEHLSHLVVSRPKQFLTLLVAIPFAKLQKMVTKPEHVNVQVNGQSVTTSYENYVRVLKMYDDYMIASTPKEESNVTVHGFMELVTGFLAKNSLDGLSEDDIKKANNQFTYLNHRSKAISLKLEMFQNILSCFMRLTFGADPFDPLVQVFYWDILMVIKDMDQYLTLPQDAVILESTLVEMRKLYVKANLMKNGPRFCSAYSSLIVRFENRFKLFEALIQKAIKSIGGIKDRITPLSVAAFGPPKTGKSAFFSYAMRQITFLDGEDDAKKQPEYTHDQTYTYNDIDFYFSNYHNQKYVIIDDAFKTENVEDRAKISADLIGMVNTAPMSCNMPDVESKGTRFFDSEYIFTTSNLLNNGIKGSVVRGQLGLTCPDALLRRFHLALYRADPVEPDVRNNVWRVDQCLLFPHFEGRVLSSDHVIDLMRACRDKQKMDHLAHIYTADQLRVINKTRERLSMEPHFDGTKAVKDVDMSVKIFQEMLAQEIYDWCKSPNLKYYIGAFTAALFIYKFKDYINLFKEDDPKVAIAEMVVHSPDKRDPIFNKRMFKMMQHVTIDNAPVSAKKAAELNATDPGRNMQWHSKVTNYYSNLVKNVSKSLVTLGAVELDKDGVKHLAYYSTTCWHLQKGYFCASAHFFIELDHVENEIKLFICIKGKPYPFSYEGGYTVAATDFVMFKPNISVDLPPELYKHLVPMDKSYDIPEGSNMQLLSIDEVGVPIITQLYKASTEENVDFWVHEHHFLVQRPITYWENTKHGQSCGPIVVCHDNGKAYVVGFHVGCRPKGDKQLSVAYPICSDFVDMIFHQIENGKATHSSEVVVHSLVEKFDDDFAFPHSVDYRVAKPANMATKARIHKTCLHGLWGEPVSIPARLVPWTNEEGVKLNPYIQSIRKLHQVEFPATDIPELIEELLFKAYPKRPSRLLSLDEAVAGVVDLDIHSIAMDTSPGYPFNEDGKTKCDYIEHNLVDNTYAIKPFFRELVEGKLSDLRAGKQISVIYQDALKSECLPKEKVAKGKARTTFCGPLDFTLICRIYLGDFISYIQSRHNISPISLGIDVHSVEWAALYLRMSRTNKSVMSGDFSNFDGTLPAFVGKYIANFVNKWYDDGPVNAKARELIFENVYYAKHLYQDCVYTVKDGNPSGWLGTTFYNSLQVFVMICTVLIEDLGLSYNDFELAIYGDDSLITANKAGLRCLDLQPHLMRRFGMIYTHFSKGESEDYDTLDTVRFLSRKFNWVGSICWAPLEERNILEIPYWRRSNKDKNALLLSTLNSFNNELAHLGRKAYNDKTREVYEVLSRDAQPLAEAYWKATKAYGEYVKNYNTAVLKTRVQGQEFSTHSKRTDANSFTHHVSDCGDWEEISYEKYKLLPEYPAICEQFETIPLWPGQVETSDVLACFANVVLFEAVFTDESTIKKFQDMAGPHLFTYHPETVLKVLLQAGDPILLEAWTMVFKPELRFVPHSKRTELDFAHEYEVVPGFVEPPGLQLFRHFMLTPLQSSDVSMDDVLAFVVSLCLDRISDMDYDMMKSIFGRSSKNIYVYHPTTVYNVIKDMGPGWIKIYNMLFSFDTHSKKMIPGSPEYVDMVEQMTYSGQTVADGNIDAEGVLTFRKPEYTERATVEPMTSQLHDLGQMRDTAPLSHGIANTEVIQPVYRSNNLGTFENDRSLSRQYPVGTYTWSSTQATSTVLATINFPDFFLSQTYLANNLSNFRYLVSGTRVTIQLQTTKYQSGALIAAWHPNVSMLEPSTGIFSSVYSMSGLPHMIMEADEGGKIIFDMPFVSKKRFLDMTSYVSGEMGTLVISVMVPLNSVVAGATSSQVFVTASMLDPKVIYPITTHSRREAHNKSAKGSISDVLGKAADVAGFLTAAPYVGNFAALFTAVAKPASYIAKEMGLDKPLSTALTEVTKVNTYADFNLGKGLSTVPTMAMDPENCVTSVPIVGGISTDEMDLSYIVGTPMLVDMATVSQFTTVPQLISNLDTDRNCYCDYICRMFDSFSGSMKFMLYITASSFQTARLVFWLCTPAAGTAWQDCYHMIVDVQKSTKVSFTIPYMDSTVMRNNYTGGNNRIYCSVLSFEQPDMTVTCPMTIKIYKAMGEDAQFGGLLDTVFVWHSNPRADFSEVFKPFQEDMTAYKHDRLVYGEQYKSVREIVRRVMPQYATAGTTVAPLWNPKINLYGTYYAVGIHAIAMLYSFWRGSMIFRAVNTQPDSQHAVSICNTAGYTLGGIGVATSTNTTTDLHVPYYYPDMFQSTRIVGNSLQFKMSTVASSTGSQFVNVSFGDDGRLAFLTPPPSLGYFQPQQYNSQISYAWLREFYDT
jgi:hypothetical protein